MTPSMAVAACMLLLSLGLVMRLFELPGGGPVLALAFVYLLALPVVRLLWALVVLARIGHGRFVPLGLLVLLLLLSMLAFQGR